MHITFPIKLIVLTCIANTVVIKLNECIIVHIYTIVFLSFQHKHWILLQENASMHAVQRAKLYLFPSGHKESHQYAYIKVLWVWCFAQGALKC